MECQYSDDTMPLRTSISACHPHGNNFLEMEVILPLVQAYHIHKTGSLSSQTSMQVTDQTLDQIQ
jgi:hypothetical protein